ncbi:MFS transporter [Microbulbifer thermotolerans]|uniref:MFS transporter n=1 Tax=Microbulbifer thermotolerans TaxID=252514 RepID=UPI00224B7A01|nr:MFS transporter [Microbulbifer thermotolerans]MCX2782145.1 MFS transporter [Microbulbifer thermotolerans]MCX2836074.1 MFS transporter [Microbulbifer thermotolerans]
MSSLPKTGAFALLSVATLTIMVGAVVAPGLPVIAQNLQVSGLASWLITLPSLGAVIFAPLAGRLIDRYGAYRCLTIGLLLYGLIGASGALLEGLVPVFLNRLVLGGITAIVMAGGTTLISHWYQGHARLHMIAKQGMAIELGGVVFLFIGGLLASQGWQWPFALYLVSWLVWAMLLKWVPANSTHRESSPQEASSGRISSALTTVYLAAAVAMMVFFSAIVSLPIRLNELGYSEAQTGYLLSYISLIAVIAAMAMPYLACRTGEMKTLVVAFCLFSVCHAAFSASAATAMLILGGTFAGFGFGFSIPLLNHMTVERSHAQVRGRNLAYLTMAIFLGQFLTSFLEFLPGSSDQVFAVAGVLAAVFAVLYLALSIVKKKPQVTG